MHLNIAWNYAGRTELVDAFRRLLAAGVAPEEVDERTISEALYTGGLPDPDLVIRTGGEYRISNFLIWQSAYAELVFEECLWPDFGRRPSTPRSSSSRGAPAGSAGRERAPCPAPAPSRRS